jgi:LCP family protein required for cell wall assembly
VNDPTPGPPEYKVYRARRRPRAGGGDLDSLRKRLSRHRDDGDEPRGPRGPRDITVGRVAKWIAIAIGSWLLLSLVLFLISAQTRPGVSPETERALSSSGNLFSGSNILVLGSDVRKGDSIDESQSGPGRSDTIMLVHSAFGSVRKLSIPRDVEVSIPGHGVSKVNAAYAFGGPALATQTVKQFLGIEVNHVVEVSFENFPQLIDALGGVTYKGGCVHSKINGGRSNGGTTLRLKRGETEIDGDQALALARTRKNLCNPSEDDLTRARRQQQLVAAMKDKVTSFETFIRLPWVSWAAPRAVRSDMAGPTLLGVVGASLTGGAGKQRVLQPSGGVTLPGGGAGLAVDDATKRAAVERFLRG